MSKWLYFHKAEDTLEWTRVFIQSAEDLGKQNKTKQDQNLGCVAQARENLVSTQPSDSKYDIISSLDLHPTPALWIQTSAFEAHLSLNTSLWMHTHQFHVVLSPCDGPCC